MTMRIEIEKNVFVVKIYNSKGDLIDTYEIKKIWFNGLSFYPSLN